MSWTPLTNQAPLVSQGVSLQLSDGSVITLESDSQTWNKLTPDANGSYVNGTFTTISPMKNPRLFFSSQILKDGRVYVVGGEYPEVGPTGGMYPANNPPEIYDPDANTWSIAGNPPVPGPTGGVSDASSEIFDNGTILQADVWSKMTYNYDPTTQTYTVTVGQPSLIQDESSWLKLPDNSILYIGNNFGSGPVNSERYIPSSDSWIADSPVPVQIYDNVDAEMGPAFMLPNGNGFMTGGTNNTVFYTPSGSTGMGTWTVGPNMPNVLGPSGTRFQVVFSMDRLVLFLMAIY